MHPQDRSEILDNGGRDGNIRHDDPQITIPSPSMEPPDNGTAIEQNIYLDVVKYYYQTILKYPHVYSGLQFGCHYVLYRDHPQFVHSTYAIYVIYPNTQESATATTGTDLAERPSTHMNIPWYTIQTLVRMMADLHKTLILVNIEEFPSNGNELESPVANVGIDDANQNGCRSEDRCKTATTNALDKSQHQHRNSRIIRFPSDGKTYSISELTITTEHAPFRQQQQSNLSKVS